ncbi:MAG TPA: TonB-dependent receptor plug domain-containing protein [Rhizomicrobium sp.]|nr:TonB-dependent receptor plug domain-containing protein [Rhizomicrobium sp.]
MRSLALAWVYASPAAGQTHDLSVPEQALSQSLKQVGQQTGASILFAPSVVEGLRGHALRGQMTARQAVDELLRGSGLVAVPDGAGFLIERPPQVSIAPVAPPRETLARPAPVREVRDLSLPVEQVVVSPTRILSSGFNAPTPLTVVTAAELQAKAKPNVFETLTDLPQLQGSTGVQYNTGATSNGLIGLSAFNLRGLSALRTLTLLDSQRVVPSNYNGVVDISEIPQMLIQRVDVVTGGASASWGSDAVAGVINFVTEKKYEGFRMNAMAGLSTYGDMGTVNFQVAAGSRFAGGRGHFEMAGEYSYNDGLLPRYPTNLNYGTQPENLEGRQLFRLSGTAGFGTGNSPAGLADTIYGPLPQNATSSNYGSVAGGTRVGVAFDAQGKPYKFNLAGNCYVAPKGAVNPNTGAVLNSNTILGTVSGTCFGTPSNPGDQSQHGFVTGLVMPLTRGSLYSRVSYDLTPNTEIYATLLYSAARTQNTPAQGTNGKALNIKCDNPYMLQTGLYASTATCLADYPNGIPLNSGGESVPLNQQVFFLRTTRRYVVGGNGVFDLLGKSWTWDSYFQHGESDAGLHIENMLLAQSPVDAVATAAHGGNVVQCSALNRWNLASDAVSGPQGTIVCRNTVAQSFGCVPFNPFGAGPINPVAQAYIFNQNQPGGTTIGPSAVETVRQEAFSFSVNGSPMDDWAGPVSVAAGYEYREEHYSQRGDPYGAGVSWSTPATVNEPCTDPAIDCGFSSLGSLGSYSAGNYHNGRGTYHVNEAFVEFGVPLLDDSFWGKADLDIGGRYARYSTAGDAITWKVGLTWDTPVPGVRLRALQSRDVRAPNLSELFAPVTGVNACVQNDVTRTPTYNGQQDCLQINEGNRLLKPERSQTTSIGLVWQPESIPGFQISMDYFRIRVQGVIAALPNLQYYEDLCILANNPSFCGQDVITTANGVNQSLSNPGGPTEAQIAQGITNVPNQITAVHSKPFNASSLTTDGFDIEAGYQFDLQDYDVPGTFNLRSLATHVSKFILDPGNISGVQRNVELAGNLGGTASGQTYTQSGGTVMTWKLQEVQSYQDDVWGFNLTERWYADGVSTNKNTIVCAPGTCPKGTFQSPTINYNRVDAVLYLDVGFNWNVTPRTQLYTRIDNVTNLMPPDTQAQLAANSVYDVVGRMYRVGVRFND